MSAMIMCAGCPTMVPAKDDCDHLCDKCHAQAMGQEPSFTAKDGGPADCLHETEVLGWPV